MIIRILFISLSFFIDFFGCSVSHLSKDTWHIIFNFVFNDTKYQQLNARRFFSYLRSDSDECYRIAFPAVAQTNKILYCAFQESLSGHTRTYLKHNILTMLAEKYNPYNKLLLPATKFLYLFSDIQSEKKDTEIQLSVNEIEDVYITKQEKYKVFKENYNSVIVPYQKIHSTMTGKALNQLIDEKNTAQIFVRKLELKKEAQEHELRTLSDEKYPEARSALGNLISQQTNELKKEIEAFKYSSLIVEMYQRLQALSAVILKQPINDIAHLNLVVLIKKVNEKNEKKKLKLRNQMTVLLKLKIIQIFSSFINSDKHRDVVTSANKYESSIKAATEKLVGIDLNKEYFEYFFRQYDDEIENIESLFWSTLKCITAKKEGLIIPYLPAKNNELVIDFTQSDLRNYYLGLNFFAKNAPPILRKNITAINLFINPNTCIEMGIVDAKFQKAYTDFVHTDLFVKLYIVDQYIQNGIFIIDRNYYVKPLNDFITSFRNISFENMHTINLKLGAETICSKDFIVQTLPFVETFLKKKMQNGVLPLHGSLLKLVKHKDESEYKSLFENIHTISCHAQTFKKFDKIIREWYLVGTSNNFLHNPKLTITVPSNEIKRDCEKYSHFHLFFDNLVSFYSSYKDDFFDPCSIEKSYITFIDQYLLYFIYNFLSYWYTLSSLDREGNVDILVTEFLCSAICLASSLSQYFGLKNDKVFFLYMLTTYLVFGMQLYRSVFIHRSFLLSITTTFILADLYHMNKLEILPTAIRFAIDTIKNKYYIFPAIETTVEQANTSQ